MRAEHVTSSGAHIPRPLNNYYFIHRKHNGISPNGKGDRWKTLDGKQRQPYVNAQKAAKELKGEQQRQNVQQTFTKRPRKKNNQRCVDSVSAPKSTLSIGDNLPAYNGSMLPPEGAFLFTFTFAAPMPMPAVLTPMQPAQKSFPRHSLPPYGYGQATNTSSSRGMNLSGRPAFRLPTDSGFTFVAPKPVQQNASPVPYAQSSDCHAPTVSQSYNSSVEGNAPVGMDWTSDAQGSYHDDANVNVDRTVMEEVAVAVSEDTKMTNTSVAGKVKPEIDIMKLAPYLVDYLENHILSDINDALDITDSVEDGLFRSFA